METAAAKRNHEVGRQTEYGGMIQKDERTLGLRKYILSFKTKIKKGSCDPVPAPIQIRWLQAKSLCPHQCFLQSIQGQAAHLLLGAIWMNVCLGYHTS